MTIFVCGPDDCGFGECMNCGGSATLGGTQEPLRTPIGIFCSDECFQEAHEFQERAKAPTRYSGCRNCGLDNFEHTDDCAGPLYRDVAFGEVEATG